MASSFFSVVEVPMIPMTWTPRERRQEARGGLLNRWGARRVTHHRTRWGNLWLQCIGHRSTVGEGTTFCAWWCTRCNVTINIEGAIGLPLPVAQAHEKCISAFAALWCQPMVFNKHLAAKVDSD